MKKISFVSRENFIEPPTPAAEKIADWYKNIPKFPVDGNRTQVGVKSCVPFRDAMTAGYYLVTPCDIKVEQTASGPYFSWRIGWSPVDSRDGSSTRGLQAPHGFEEYAFAWWVPYVFESSKTTSFLITHPFNRNDLPFFTTSGIVDLTSVLDSGHLPFFIRKGFEGVIPKGTPYAQILPFQRDSWALQLDEPLIKKGDAANYNSISKFFGYYRDNVWSKKIYKGLKA